MNLISEVLNTAADLLEPEGAWCQGAHGKNKRGEYVCCIYARTASRCAIGAIERAGRVVAVKQYVVDRAIGKLSRTIHKRNIARWNDAPERTQAQVVHALRRAAQLANESQGKEA